MTDMGPQPGRHLRPEWEPPSGGQPAPAPRRRSGPPPVYPPIPASPPPPQRGGARTALVALISAIIGGLLASGVLLVALRQTAPQVSTAEEAPVQQIRSPVVSGADEDPTRVEAVAAAVLPTVVQIDVDGEGIGSSGNGSGVIYRSDGYILTNNHVVENAGRLTVVFADGATERGTVVGRDELSDTAVIRVDRRGLEAIAIGDSESLRVGQLAVAIGSPFGLEGSVTAGVVSALNRPISVGEGIRLPSVIQTDAPINPGNSGGALVGGDGRLIGINSAILTAGAPANAGVGFAIPVNIAVDVADELIASGDVVYPFLGVEGSDVTPEAAGRLGVEQGAHVERVHEGTPAENAGLRRGDVIVSLEGAAITSMDDLILAIRESDVGDTVELDYVRNKRRRTAEIRLAERPEG